MDLTNRLEAVRQATGATPAIIAGLARFIAEAPDEALFRVNPLAYAAAEGLAEGPAIDLFIHAARVGLFELSWDVICYGCGTFLQREASLTGLRAQDRCQICALGVETVLDDSVEVAFTVSPEVRSIRYHHPELLPAGPELMRVLFSPNRVRPPEFEARLEAGRVFVDILEPGATRTFTFELEAETYRLVSATHHAGLAWEVVGPPATEPQRVRVRAHALGLDLRPERTAPGPVTLEVCNEADRAVSLSLLKAAAGRPQEAQATALARFLPFLTGKRMLTNQAFRDLYGQGPQAPRGNFALRSLTFLFTDLKDSTQLYERVGDLHAYELVQQHFRILQAAVAAHEGAIVKTIGDAVMATFHRPELALRAAVQMHRELTGWNRARPGEQLGLKVGLHAGPCIAVNTNDRLDYFGTTVNQAARIQGLAEGGQIYLSDAILRTAGLREAMEGEVTFFEPQEVRLKGIRDLARVHCAVPIYRLAAPGRDLVTRSAFGGGPGG